MHFRRPRSAFALGLLVVGAASSLACREEASPAGPTDFSQGGSGLIFVPAGGAPSGQLLEPCSVGDLAEHCADNACPASPDAVTTSCGPEALGSATRSATDCDGSVVSVDFGFGAIAYYFDESEALMGIYSLSDIVTTCPDGHDSIARQVGEVCAPVGEPVDACGAGGAPASGGAGGAP